MKFDLRNPPPFGPVNLELKDTGYPVALDMVLKSMNLRHFRERDASGLEFVITGSTPVTQELSRGTTKPKATHSTNNYGHARDYSWLRGILSRDSDGLWSITYDLKGNDEYSGNLGLTKKLEGYRSGEIIEVRGMITTEAVSPLGKPLYKVVSIERPTASPSLDAANKAKASLPSNQEILLFVDVHKSGVHTVTSPPMRLFEFLTLEAGIQAEIKTLSTNVRVVRKKKIVFPGQLARHQYDDFLLAHGDTVVVHGIERTKPGGESPKSVEVTIIHPKTLPLIVKLEPNKAKASDVLAEAGVTGKLQIIRTCPNAPPGDLDAETVLIHGDILMVEPSPIVKSPALRIKKSVASRATVGQPLVSTILIENLGTAVAKEIVVQDQVPEGTKLTGTIPQGKLDDTKSKLTWLFESLEPGEQKQIKISVVPEQAGKVGTVATVAFKTQSGSTFGDSPTIHRTSPDEGTSYVDTEPPKNERKKAPDLDALAKEIAILKKSATEARTKYGPRHPKVLELERRERFMMSFLLKQRAESKTDNEAEVPFGADLDEESGQDGFGAAQDSCIEPNTPKQQLWTCQRLVAPRIPDTRLGWSLVYHLRPVG